MNTPQHDRHPNKLAHFLRTPLDTLLDEHARTDPQQNLLALFARCVRDVPAYRPFLARHGIDPATIASYQDFARLPLMNKANYMQAFALAERCFGGSLAGADRIAVSSGSTGVPTFWPRSAHHEADVAIRFEQVFRDSFSSHQRSTLAVVCFALGNWVGGMFTTSCCWHLANKGYPLLVATPGNSKPEILRIVRELAGHFEQTVLLGYPPFVKDVIDAGLAEGLDWSRCNLKLVFAGEVFSEEWRSLVGQRTGSRAPCFDSASLYGTADGGVLGNETPLSIAIRRWLAQQPQAARELFGESRLPTLVQYDPCNRFFEVDNGTLVLSGESSVPLLRYHIADQGGVSSYDELWQFLRDHGINGLADLDLPPTYQPRHLPFVHVFGRADFTVSFYGANIYPENITIGLERPAFASWLTGKFVLRVDENQGGDKVLAIAVELLPGVGPAPDMAAMIADSVRHHLLRLNSEFAHYTPPERQTPVISLHDFGDPNFFPVGVKHRYTRQ
ncbi:MAG: phenylacetate--CoA ligase family protein [Methylomonas sp.]|nr:phenylacetate--CoA ligase family protein [Methylomonas sp.]PPD21951.1 MAG: phenylacetate--CoA ligase [Methylomonas sp.]PPD25733.1 MAG: phenylacetate--CoA ligase [Methylomonas sp.]PPD36986.1 MAG: phenylacetate--CoA ligase [Methylomonas sp.]PPD39111.1 MAG: phenylacetate--CoA ligase [Methylomonas sp.]